MKTFELFGVKMGSLSNLTKIIAEATGCTFYLHDSDFRGGGYYRTKVGVKPSLVVQRNSVDDEGYRIEDDFSDYSLLVYVNDGNSSISEMLISIEGLDLLRSEQL